MAKIIWKMDAFMGSKFLLILSLLYVSLFLGACGDISSSNSEDDGNNQTNSASWVYLNPAINYGKMKDSRDGRWYKTVTIGTQTWMAENLNYAYKQPTALQDSSSFCYENRLENCDKYGRLYMWSAAMDSAALFGTTGLGCGDRTPCASASSATIVRGVCPAGWHLPSYDEWGMLFNAVGGYASAGRMLKSARGWYAGGLEDDPFGFSALPAGIRTSGTLLYGSGTYEKEGYYAFFWSSTEKKGAEDPTGYVPYQTYFFSFYYKDTDVTINYTSRGEGYSVRCVKD